MMDHWGASVCKQIRNKYAYGDRFNFQQTQTKLATSSTRKQERLDLGAQRTTAE
jgi:hypothetical protein